MEFHQQVLSQHECWQTVKQFRCNWNIQTMTSKVFTYLLLAHTTHYTSDTKSNNKPMYRHCLNKLWLPSYKHCCYVLLFLDKKRQTNEECCQTCAWYLRSLRILPVVKFQTSMKPSTEPVIKYWPSGENLPHSTWAFCPNWTWHINDFTVHITSCHQGKKLKKIKTINTNSASFRTTRQCNTDPTTSHKTGYRY